MWDTAEYRRWLNGLSESDLYAVLREEHDYEKQAYIRKEIERRVKSNAGSNI